MNSTSLTSTTRSLHLVGIVISALLLVPLIGVFSSIFVADQGTWAHLSRTILPGLAANSLMLAVGVAVGVAIIGTLTAWLTANHEFPGRRLLEWTLILPLAIPAYVLAYTYTDVLQYAGPVQTFLRESFGWQKQDYWFP